jgi:hypothetical protein
MRITGWLCAAMLGGAAASDILTASTASADRLRELKIITDSATPDVVVTLGLPRTPTTLTADTSSTRLLAAATSLVTEGAADRGMLKMIVVKDDSSDTFYNGVFRVGNALINLRLDLLQADLWVMNGNDFIMCDDLRIEVELATSKYGVLYFDTETTMGPATVHVCAEGGTYTTLAGQSFPSPVAPGVQNGERYDLPYINDIAASGVLATDEVAFLSLLDYEILLGNFTFVVVNETNVYYGGVGLAGSPTGTGFLDAVERAGLALLALYLLWFFNGLQPLSLLLGPLGLGNGTDGIGELLLGAVNTKYLTGPFVEYDMIPHTGPRFLGDRASLIARLKLPIVAVGDIRVENSVSGATQLLFSQSEEGQVLPMALNLRLQYLYVPLALIINLALQTNALYNADVNRWIVSCLAVRLAEAFMRFVVGPLTVRVPLSDFLIEATYGYRLLNFADGLKACFLAFFPESDQGFSLLGLPFLTLVYLAVDNLGDKLALANVARNVLLDALQFDLEGAHALTLAASKLGAATTRANATTALDALIAYIVLGTIPFALLCDAAQNVTLTYLLPTTTAVELIPARFLAILIQLGELFVTLLLAAGTLSYPGMASAALASLTLFKAAADRGSGGSASGWMLAAAVGFGALLA